MPSSTARSVENSSNNIPASYYLFFDSHPPAELRHTPQAAVCWRPGPKPAARLAWLQGGSEIPGNATETLIRVSFFRRQNDRPNARDNFNININIHTQCYQVCANYRLGQPSRRLPSIRHQQLRVASEKWPDHGASWPRRLLPLASRASTARESPAHLLIVS